MSTYCFDEQSQLLEIAIQIIEDYDVIDWSFGGGTALSCVYYKHRMSYDIDIFTTDFESINNLISHKEEIASSLDISKDQVEASPSGITFILSEDDHQLKLDFLYSELLSAEPLQIANVLEQSNINVQTTIEIISKKLKYREILTIRDFVDFAYAQENDKVLTKIKELNIIDLERFIDVLTQFESISEEDFNLELKYLNPTFMNEKRCITEELFSALTPNNFISIAINENFEVLAIDNWIKFYQDDYESVGEYNIYEHINKQKISDLIIKNIDRITYEDIYQLEPFLVKKLLPKL
ncbi:nucleotidyl transferase AbiEii/AbiGii toxin family protein [Arcobacter peruensis]|uniref:nucleotidyl transferase AbiEii/AbiGii toxin family protein n=1 Tax=Arcobacter peruensis TaxID=2320140 RepID=UPI000F0910AA|nr:nucleotidyl transferase AbiEii/AbiGii toxin family protein [Arcobacter peruensis]